MQRVRDLLSEAPGAAKAEETDKESALECIKAYRKVPLRPCMRHVPYCPRHIRSLFVCTQACVDGLCPVPAFNDYLRTFRDAYSVANNSGPQPAFAKFYTTLLEEKISLITKLEASSFHLFYFAVYVDFLHCATLHKCCFVIPHHVHPKGC